MKSIYLDYNASTPIDPAVAAAMRPHLADSYGNPSSGHWAATPAKVALDTARAQVAAAIGADPESVIFTSGATESNNLALKGVAEIPGRRVMAVAEARGQYEDLFHVSPPYLALPQSRADDGGVTFYSRFTQNPFRHVGAVHQAGTGH